MPGGLNLGGLLGGLIGGSGGGGGSAPSSGGSGTTMGAATPGSVSWGCPHGMRMARPGEVGQSMIVQGEMISCIPNGPARTAPAAPAPPPPSGAPPQAPSPAPPEEPAGPAGPAAGLAAANQPEAGASMLYAPLGIRQGIGQRHMPPLDRILNGLRVY